MSIDQRAALDDVPLDVDLLVSRAELAAALTDRPEVGGMSTARLLAYLLATVAITVLVAIVWSVAN
jgi:hypothetical protein